MTLITGPLLAATLSRRQASLFHACQLRDFSSYVELGGVPSRAVLESMPHTAFASDYVDKRNGVWDKVFFNLADFSSFFARGYASVPNPYGPICLQLTPSVLESVQDCAVCLRSAGSTNFERTTEGLRDDQLASIFRYPEERSFPDSATLLFPRELKRAFPDLNATSSPEVSVTTKTGCIPLSAVIAIWVDAYKNLDLLDRVRELAPAIPFTRERSYADGRRTVSLELGERTAQRAWTLSEVAADGTASVATRAWAASALANDLGWQFERYTRYLREGTLSLA